MSFYLEKKKVKAFEMFVLNYKLYKIVEFYLKFNLLVDGQYTYKTSREVLPFYVYVVSFRISKKKVGHSLKCQ